jgi:RNA recognition motif-containing protein
LHYEDVCLALCRDGQSRQFGFVGFRSVAEAQAAVKYFNRSFMGAQRLTVEFAEKYGGSHLPRAWSKYTEGTSRYKQLHQVLQAGLVVLRRKNYHFQIHAGLLFAVRETDISNAQGAGVNGVY